MKKIMATFNEKNNGFQFYELLKKYPDGEYLLKKQGYNEYFVYIKSLSYLISLPIILPPDNEEELYRAIELENTVDEDCFIFYADSIFVKMFGIWNMKDIISLKNKCIEIKSTLTRSEDIIDKMISEGKINLKVIICMIKTLIQKRKIKKNLKGFGIIW